MPVDLPSAVRRPPPLGLCLAGLGLQRALHRGGGQASSSRRRATLVVGGGSVGLLAWSVASFRARRTTVDPRPGARPAALVVGGPMTVSRNPMYVGMAGLLLAGAVRRGGLAPWLPVAAFVAWVDRVQVPEEEAALRQEFGGEFDAYAARVRRWLGPA